MILVTDTSGDGRGMEVGETRDELTDASKDNSIHLKLEKLNINLNELDTLHDSFNLSAE